MKRRTFLAELFIGSALANLPLTWVFSKDKKTEEFQVPKRPLSNTGDTLSMIGFGSLLLRNNGQQFANKIVAKAVDAGINYFDVAPGYGNAEELLGPALQPYRKNCFLACKTHQWDKKEAEKKLHNSLRKLQTDYFDLYQLHGLSKVEKVEKAFAPHGIMELLEKAKKEGKVRNLGFSAHSEEAALKAMEKYDFDTILFPINFVCWYHGNFGPRVYQKAKEKQMGILAIKSMAKTRLPKGKDRLYKNVWYKPVEDKKLSDKALRFSLSKDVTASIPPADGKFILRAIEHSKHYSPLTAEEDAYLQNVAKSTDPLFKRE